MKEKNDLLVLLIAFILLILEIFIVTRVDLNPSESQLSAIIVPHHNLVKNKREEFLEYVSQKTVSPKTVILISPNHFSLNQNAIYYSDQNWELSNGNILFDTDTLNSISGLMIKENGILANDHGIFNLLPEIKEYFPNSKILPILIGHKTPIADIKILAENLSVYCNSHCLYIGSVDFSHYLPASIAYIHDVYSRKILENNDFENILNLEVDSPKTLYLISKMIGNSGMVKFNTYYLSNSGIVESNYDAETTGYLMGWYDENPADRIQNNNSFTFVFAKEVNKDPKVKGLGERFFYGADYTNMQLNKKVTIANILIEPENGDVSSIIQTTSGISIKLGNDIVIGGIVNDRRTFVTILPIEKMDGEDLFIRGNRKREIIEKLFSYMQTNENISVDQNRGTIIIDN